MRIIGGRLGGRRLAAPRGRATRPTAERVREGIASALEARGWIEGAAVLELFAGTGALSFEALSRGAARAVLIDKDPAMARAIGQSARQLGLGEAVQALALDLSRDPKGWMGRLPDAEFDLVFVDPPYARIEVVTSLLAAAWECGKLRPGAAVVVEHERRRPPTLPPGFGEVATYRYGDTAVVLSTAPERHGTELHGTERNDKERT